MLIPPGKLGEEYSVLVEGGAPPVLRVLHGDCCIDGVAHTPSSQTSTLSPGESTLKPFQILSKLELPSCVADSISSSNAENDV